MFTKNRVSFKNTTIDDKKFVTQRDEMWQNATFFLLSVCMFISNVKSTMCNLRICNK